MLGCDYIFIFYLLIFLWASDGSIGNNCSRDDGTCCANYYRDVESRLCKHCIGSFGHNCVLPCPPEFFGHACMEKCDCNSTQACDPKMGCVAKNNDQIQSTINITYVILIVACFLTITILGTVLYFQFVKRATRRKRSNTTLPRNRIQ